jgi:uncharacterized protein (TIGR02270 family)
LSFGRSTVSQQEEHCGLTGLGCLRNAGVMSVVNALPLFDSTTFQGVLEQYLDNASFLWILRSIAINQPHYNSEDLHELELRIDAQIDGLMLSADAAWNLCDKLIEQHDAGEVFVAAIIAFRSHDTLRIQRVVDSALKDYQATKALVSALSWLPAPLVHNWLEKFINSKNFAHKYLALAVFGARRENPGELLTRILQREDCQADVRLYSRALRLVGELRRQDLMPVLMTSAKSEDSEIRFWAIWSAILLGKHDLVDHLLPVILREGPNQYRALELAFRVLDIDKARGVISRLSKDQQQSRAVIRACAVLGDPHAINWVIEKMSDQSCARLCGEAFSQITGVNLENNGLTRDISNEDRLSELEESEDIEMDEDENLPWPDVEKVKSAWIAQGHRFISGRRYFMGNEISLEHLKEKLETANQRQRHAAALELALIDSSQCLVNTQARAS